MSLSDERIKYKKELYQAGVQAIAVLMEQLQEDEDNLAAGAPKIRREIALTLLQIIESGKDG